MTTRVRRTYLLVALSVASTSGAQSYVAPKPALRDSAEASLAHTTRPQAMPAIATGSMRIDGALTEPDWARAVPITQFTQIEPNAGREPSERTEVRVLLMTDAILIGARMHDREARSLRPRLSRRDDNALSDRITVTLDPFHNHRTGALFTVTPAGSLIDATVGGRVGRDASWDPVWEAATAVDDSGWTAEMRIPLSQLRYSSGVESWGLQIERFILRTQERDAFAFIPQNESGFVEHFGHLSGMSGVRATRNLEVLPYVSGRASYLAAPNSNALSPSRQNRARIGGDLRELPRA